MAFDVKRANIEITATDKTKVAFDSIKNSLKNLTGQFGGLSAVIGVGAFAAFTKRIIDQADSFNDLSKRTGIAVERIGAWRLATEQSGTSMEALTTALAKGSKYLVQHGDDLQKIGINAKTSEELILQLSGIISKLPSDDPRRTALAMQVLGKSAGELIPLLSEGEAGLRKWLARGRELNPVTAQMAKNADEFNDSLAEMKLISGGLFVGLVGKILPSLNSYLNQLKSVVDEGDWMDKLLFFSVGYVPGKIADKTEKPEVQIQKYTQRIVELKKELAGLPNDVSGFGNARRGNAEKELFDAQFGLNAQRARLPFKIPKGSGATSFDATNLDAFLKPENSEKTKRDATADSIRDLERENKLLAQGVSLEDARTIARLKSAGATDQQIVKMLNATAVQNQFEQAQKSAEKAQEDFKKATEDHTEAMRAMLETADEAVISAQRATRPKRSAACK
jgi:DNA-binding transcriptional MerR regulator